MSTILKSSMFILSASLLMFISCSKDSIEPEVMPEPEEMEMKDFVIYTGDNLTFSKAEESDPSLESNQDRITDNVWITRANDGGQIFNIKSENSSDKNKSPAGTEWAIGKIDDIANLEFKSFRDAVDKPKDVVGKDLVMHLVEADEYLQVKFTFWSQSKSGGFSYERATK